MDEQPASRSLTDMYTAAQSPSWKSAYTPVGVIVDVADTINEVPGEQSQGPQFQREEIVS